MCKNMVIYKCVKYVGMATKDKSRTEIFEVIL